MIKEIILEYFEIWEKGHFVFSEGVNYIIGDNDQGKSSIRRALEWVKNNKPAGTSFKNRKNKNKDTTVTIITTEGYVKRIRGKNKNYYELNGEKLNAVGRSNVPKEVSDFLQIDDVNIQNQFDTFFLLQDSPSTVAKKFNDYIGLSLIDKVAKEAETTVRHYNKKTSQYNEQIKKLKKELTEYKDLNKVNILIKKAKKLKIKIKKNSEIMDQIESLLNNLESLENELSFLPDLKSIFKLLNKSSKELISIQKIDSEIKEVSSLIRNFTKLNKKIKTLKNLSEIQKLMSQATALQKKSQIDSESILQVEQYLINYNKLSLISGENTKELTHLKKKLDETHKNLKVCPLCKQKWNKTE